MATEWDCPVPGSEDYDITASYDMGGVELSIRYRWWPRRSGWFVDISNADEVLVVEDHRLCGGATLFTDRTADGLPDGPLYLVSPEDMDQHHQLGTATLLYLTPDEAGE